jgi:endonuclease/exonuclease/phosphatase (EEP) superfamily protein YafD
MKNKYKDLTTRYAIAISWVYFTILFGWLILYVFTGDRFGYLGIFNSLAVYLFIPLPFAAVLGLWTHRRDVIIGTILGTAVFLWLWGPFFMPHLDPPSKGGNPHPPLTVMTYNVLGMHAYTDPVVEVIRQVDADVVFIQELNNPLAEVVRTTLSDEYPYQILDPIEGVSGIGTISRYPLEPTGEQLPLKWVGIPQVMSLDFDGDTVTLLNFHTFALAYYPLEHVNSNFRYREAQAQALVDFADRIPGPLIVAGDANATPLSDMYQTIIRSPLEDTWQRVGFGFGHTFPGSDLPGSSRLRIGNWFIPQWLARIDYIFISPHWGVITTELAPFDGVSDHRGVVAVLVLQSDQ